MEALPERISDFLSHYSGKLQASRMVCIAKQTPSLTNTLLRHAYTLISEGLDVKEYKNFIQIAHKHGLTDITETDTIILRMDEKLLTESERLRLELNTHKQNVRRDETLSTYIALGNLYYDSGDYDQSYQLYMEAMPYAVGFDQQLQILLQLIRLTTYFHKFSGMDKVMSKVQEFHLAPVDTDTKVFLSIYQASLGLHYFWLKQYSEAAVHFFRCFPEIADRWNEVSLSFSKQ